MGSIASRPKTVTMAPTAVASFNTTSSAGAVTPTPITADPHEIAQSRVENILRRSRSALGNVFTSLRGVLTSSTSSPQRKNLLGE